MAKAKSKKKVTVKKKKLRVSETDNTAASLSLQAVLKALGDLGKKDATRVLNSASQFVRGIDEVSDCECDCDCDCGY